MRPFASTVATQHLFVAALVAAVSLLHPALAQSADDDVRLGPAFAPTKKDDGTSTDGLRVVGRDPAPRATLTEFPAGTRVIAIASAIGGELNHVVAINSTGSNRVDPYRRTTQRMPDASLDAIVMRGLDRVIARRMPGTERVFMRLNPLLLDDVPVAERETVALDRLLAELSTWPQRQQWEQIVVVTPHYRFSEIRGMASKLHGIGVFVQGLNSEVAVNQEESEPDQQVLEPDGTPGKQARKNFVGLYYYASLTIVDAKTLRVLERQPWTINEKYYDSRSAALSVGKQFSIEQLAEKLVQFSERASDSALSRTLGGSVEAGPLQPARPQSR